MNELEAASAALKAWQEAHPPMDEFCEDIIRKSRATGNRYIALGLPVDYLGRTPYPRMPDALLWVQNLRARNFGPQEPPRPRGRPRRKDTPKAA